MNTNTKYWAFTWETNRQQRKLPSVVKLKSFLNVEATEGIFQLEKGTKKRKLHYQGVFTLSGKRQSKLGVLKLFQDRFIGQCAGLTLSPVHSRSAVENYVTKKESRVDGPFYVGKNEKYDEKMSGLELRDWQEKLFQMFTGLLGPIFQNRKIVLVVNEVGGAGKSFFVKWLRIGQKKLVARKLPVSSVDRLTSAVFMISKSVDVDLYTIDLPRTISENLSLTDLFHTLEEIKNSYLVDTMYGRYNEAIFNPPQIVIFTNMKFEDLRKYMSPDRWVVLQLDANQELSEAYWDYTLNQEVFTPVTDTDSLIQLQTEMKKKK